MAYRLGSVPTSTSGLTHSAQIDRPWELLPPRNPYEINWGGAGYADYQGYMKVSGQEKAAENLTAQESRQLGTWMQTQFSEQQNLLNNVMIPQQLTQMATNPQGFGAQASQ